MTCHIHSGVEAANGFCHSPASLLQLATAITQEATLLAAVPPAVQDPANAAGPQQLFPASPKKRLYSAMQQVNLVCVCVCLVARCTKIHLLLEACQDDIVEIEPPCFGEALLFAMGLLLQCWDSVDNVLCITG